LLDLELLIEAHDPWMLSWVWRNDFLWSNRGALSIDLPLLYLHHGLILSLVLKAQHAILIYYNTLIVGLLNFYWTLLV